MKRTNLIVQFPEQTAGGNLQAKPANGINTIPNNKEAAFIVISATIERFTLKPVKCRTKKNSMTSPAKMIGIVSNQASKEEPPKQNQQAQDSRISYITKKPNL